MANRHHHPEPTWKHPGLLRRLAAIFYDGLILLALWFVATAALLPLTDGTAIQARNPLFTSYLFFLAFAYFAGFWTYGGQTIGMRAWHIRVRQNNGAPLTLWHALLRFLAALGSWLALGTGFLYALFNARHTTWHDRFSETMLTLE